MQSIRPAVEHRQPVDVQQCRSFLDVLPLFVLQESSFVSKMLYAFCPIGKTA